MVKHHLGQKERKWKEEKQKYETLKMSRDKKVAAQEHRNRCALFVWRSSHEEWIQWSIYKEKWHEACVNLEGMGLNVINVQSSTYRDNVRVGWRNCIVQ
jgi:hypothetical protein